MSTPRHRRTTVIAALVLAVLTALGLNATASATAGATSHTSTAAKPTMGLPRTRLTLAGGDHAA
jgi:hypothetical protein